MLRGFLFGLTVAAAIGPIALLIINTSLRFGLNAGVRAGLGAATADLIYAIAAAFAGQAVLGALAGAQQEIKLAASVILVAMGAWLVASSLRPRPAGGIVAETPRAYLTTLGLTLVNPLTLLVFAAFIAQAPVAARAQDVALVVLGVFLGSLVVQLALALGGAAARRLFANPAALLSLNLASGAGIVAFGVAGLFGA